MWSSAASPASVKLQQYGTTNEGRPLVVAFVSSQANLANLTAMQALAQHDAQAARQRMQEHFSNGLEAAT